MNYTIGQIKDWAKEGQAISPHVVLEILDEMEKLMKFYEQEIDKLQREHCRLVMHVENIDQLREKLAVAMEALNFYATSYGKCTDESILRREYGCGCCAGLYDEAGLRVYSFEGDIQGQTAREAIAKIRGEK